MLQYELRAVYSDITIMCDPDLHFYSDIKSISIFETMKTRTDSFF